MSKNKRPLNQRIRQSGHMDRRNQGKKRYPKILIVCEGRKTEVHYFSLLKDSINIRDGIVKICGNCQSDPLKMYEYAARLRKEEMGLGDPFTHVYCVFDKDSHGTYEKALYQISCDTSITAITSIPSIPCFEYWLLHFTRTTKPYLPLTGNSACYQVESELKKYLPDYSKSDNTIFIQLEERLDAAIQNAKHALRAAADNETDNPSTRVHDLVACLQGIGGR